MNDVASAIDDATAIKGERDGRYLQLWQGSNPTEPATFSTHTDYNLETLEKI